MTPIQPTERAEKLAPWIGGLLVALPVMLVRFPPMADLPLHEASVGLLRHWSDLTFCPHDLYFINVGQTNQLFAILTLALSYVMPVPWATKTVVAMTLFTLPVAAARFADYVKAPRWTALLVAPLGLGWLFFWGLIQNIQGLVLLVAMLPTIDRFAARPTWRGVATMVGVMILFHFAHEAMGMVACLAIAVCTIGTPLRWRDMVLRAVPVVFFGGLGFVVQRWAWRLAGPRHRATYAYQWDTTLHKLWASPGVLFAGYEPYIRNLIFLLVLAPVGLFLAERIQLRRGQARSWAERAHAARFEILALALFALYMVAPASVKSTTLVYQRFLPPAWAVFAVSCAAGTAGTGRSLPRLLCAFAPVASLLVGWPTFADADRMYSDLESLLPRIDKGSAVMALDVGPPIGTRLWGPMAAMGHVIALKGGRSMYDYSQSPVSLLVQDPKKEWVESITRMETRPFDFTPSWDMLRYRYLLIATSQPSLGLAISLAIRDDAVLIGQAGDWYLYESRILQVPVTARDAWPPTPHPPTLHVQVTLASQELAAIEQGKPISP
jgi:hypothetical protein